MKSKVAHQKHSGGGGKNKTNENYSGHYLPYAERSKIYDREVGSTGENDMDFYTPRVGPKLDKIAKRRSS